VLVGQDFVLLWTAKTFSVHVNKISHKQDYHKGERDGYEITWNILADKLVLRIIRAQEEEDTNAEDARRARSGDDGEAFRWHASDLRELMNSCRFAASVRNTSPQRHARQVVRLDGPPPRVLPDRPDPTAGISWTDIVQSLTQSRSGAL